MTSDLSNEAIRQLVLDTEDNIKKIECYNEDFAVVTLNEWRYATHHAIDMMCGLDSKDNRTQAVCHLKRAYFDSADILLNCLLEKFENMHRVFRNYAPIVRDYIEDYPDKLKKAKEAKRFHGKASQIENREDFYEEIKKLCQNLEAFVEELEDTEDDWRALVRKARNKDRLWFWSVVAAIVGVIWKLPLSDLWDKATSLIK